MWWHLSMNLCQQILEVAMALKGNKPTRKWGVELLIHPEGHLKLLYFVTFSIIPFDLQESIWSVFIYYLSSYFAVY